MKLYSKFTVSTLRNLFYVIMDITNYEYYNNFFKKIYFAIYPKNLLKHLNENNILVTS